MNTDYRLRIGLDGAEEVLELIKIVRRRPEVIQRVKDLPEALLVCFEVDSSPTRRADDMVVLLKPSERLMELVGAARALKLEGGAS
jgi:hypothetical protein